MRILKPRAALMIGSVAACAAATFFVYEYVKHRRAVEARAYRENLDKKTDEQILKLLASKTSKVTIYDPQCLERIVAKPSCMPKVTTVRIFMWNHLGEPKWLLLKELVNLESVDIYDSDNPDRLFVGLEGKQSIRRIRLSSTPLSDRGVASMAKLPNLRELELIGAVNVTNEGLDQLKNSPSLEKLTLENTSVNDRGLAILAEYPKLRSLALSDDKYGGPTLTGECVQYLKKLTGLRSLVVEGGWVSQDTLESLRRSLPDCEIQSVQSRMDEPPVSRGGGG